MNPFRKRDDSELYHTLAEIVSFNREILKQQSEILDLLKASQHGPREAMLKENEELLKQVNALVRQIKMLDRLKPSS